MASFSITFWFILLTSYLYFPSTSGLTCYVCTSIAGDDCSRPEPGLINTVSCDADCYVAVTSSHISRGCGNCSSSENTCCSTDLCNDGLYQPTTPPPAEVECYDCTFRQRTDGGIKQNPSCAWEEFDPLHPLVKTKMCSSGCFVSEVTAEDENGKEYLLVRSCAEEGVCHNKCITESGYRSCNSCCNDTLCNGRRIGSVEDASPSNQCYECTYSASPSTSIGSPGCYKPFNASGEGIRKTQCSSECKLTVIRNSDTVAVQRSCSPDCQSSCEEIGDSESCVYCCSGSLCNTGRNLSKNASINLIGFVTIVSIFIGRLS